MPSLVIQSTLKRAPRKNRRLTVSARANASRSAAKKVCPETVWNVARRKLDQLDSVLRLDELRVPPGNRLEALSRDRKGQHSIRINDQYRLCFEWSSSGAANVEIVDDH